MIDRKAWFERPWRGFHTQSVTEQKTATVYAVKIRMTSGRLYEGQVITARDYRAALDLFYWRLCGLMAGKGVCLMVEYGEAAPIVIGISKTYERVRILKY